MSAAMNAVIAQNVNLHFLRNLLFPNQKDVQMLVQQFSIVAPNVRRKHGCSTIAFYVPRVAVVAIL